jgi:hypothetical protein
VSNRAWSNEDGNDGGKKREKEEEGGGGGGMRVKEERKRVMCRIGGKIKRAKNGITSLRATQSSY